MIVFQNSTNAITIIFLNLKLSNLFFLVNSRRYGGTLKVTKTTGHFTFTRWFLLS